jgi:hypothetical protein
MKVEFYTINKLEDVWVNSWNQRDGIAVFSTVDVDLKTSFDPELYYKPDTLMYLTANKNLFVVNTEHPLIQEGSQFINFNKPEKYITFDIGGANICIKSQKLSSEIEGYTEPIIEPEPSDFEVETWVPQDELPDNGE